MLLYIRRQHVYRSIYLPPLATREALGYITAYVNRSICIPAIYAAVYMLLYVRPHAAGAAVMYAPIHATGAAVMYAYTCVLMLLNL
jgi:hypothetical protein